MAELYNIIIADDEFLIREGLLSYDWERLGFKSIAAVTNGKKVLELMEQNTVDLVITDIKMPVMDGLELSKIIQDKYPLCKVIILSGYKDFDYAKLALKAGVSEYLLKPVELKELEQLICKLKLKIDEERNTSLLINNYEKQFQEILPVVVKDFFKFLVKGQISDTYEIEEKANLYEISINLPYYSCAVFQIDYRILTDQHTSIEAIISSLYSTIRELFELENIGYFYIDDNFEIVAIFNFELQSGSISSYDYITNIVKKIYNLIKHSLLPTFDLKVYCGIGNIYNSILSLSSAYSQAKRSLKRKFFDENDGIYYAWKEKSIYTSTVKEYPFDAENALLNSILEGNMEQICILLKTYWDEFNILLKQIDPTDVHNIIIQFLNMLDRRLNKHGNSLKDLMGISPPFTDFVNSMDTLISLKESINKLVYTVTERVQIINDKVRTSSFASIRQAQKYIDDHYPEKITLEQVSEKVFMSPSYFSVQFKKEMGKNFVEYLKEYRIEKAKDLLRGNNLKVYEISEMVGYQNPKYFTDMFKVYTGLTPLEYRQKIITS